MGSTIPLPFSFTTGLLFGDEDKAAMPWLSETTRYYGIEKELKKGGRAIAFKGFVSDKDGNRLPGTNEVVLKIPNLNTDEYTSDKIQEYLRRQSLEGRREWKLTRKRLYRCKYANPIFDLHTHLFYYIDEPMELSITAQYFLHDAVSLDDYLLNTKQRTEPYKSQKGISYDNWRGMNNPQKWIELVRCIAVGLSDIHQRRVVHGDIWPPNIFIRTDAAGKPYPIFIDFGEAFPIEPKGDAREQRDHAYRAPERNDAQSIVTQQADVYSFGKLMLHLAIGEEPILSRKFRGHRRREVIREKFQRNPGIIAENPFIVDIICKCVSLDPIDRPSMSDVLRAFNSYVDPKSYSSTRLKVEDRLDSLRETWRQITTELAQRNTSVGPFLEELVEQRIYDIEDMVRGLSNDVIIMNDTRERLILDLIGLFRRLEKNDRFISVTSPMMWQSSSLGLDGRYFTATLLAAVRGASIQRAFIFSIQEVGDAWANCLADELELLNKTNHYPRAGQLAETLRSEVDKYIAMRQQHKASDWPDELQLGARERLRLVIKTYMDGGLGICKDNIDASEKYTSFSGCKGIYVGLVPVSTVSEMRIRKSAQPVSVFFYNQAEPGDQYLLMMTDCLGRNSYGHTIEKEPDGQPIHRTIPELRGITVFKSVLGVPEDRIKKLEEVFKASINIGGWLDKCHAALEKADKACLPSPL